MGCWILDQVKQASTLSAVDFSFSTEPEDPVGIGCASICDRDKTNGTFHTSGRGTFLWLGLSCIDRIAIGNICLYLYNT